MFSCHTFLTKSQRRSPFNVWISAAEYWVGKKARNQPLITGSHWSQRRSMCTSETDSKEVCLWLKWFLARWESIFHAPPVSVALILIFPPKRGFIPQDTAGENTSSITRACWALVAWSALSCSWAHWLKSSPERRLWHESPPGVLGNL